MLAMRRARGAPDNPAKKVEPRRVESSQEAAMEPRGRQLRGSSDDFMTPTFAFARGTSMAVPRS